MKKIQTYFWFVLLACVGIVLITAFTPSGGLGIFLLIFGLLPNSQSIHEYFNSFGTSISQESDSEWPSIYTSRIYNSKILIIKSRLKAQNIPVIVENKNLFNSGIQFELGLAVSLKVKVPQEDFTSAKKLIND